MGLTRPRAHQLQDIDYKQSVRVVSTTNVTLSGGAPSVVDGVSVTIGDRVLVTGQSTGSENGLYYVTTVGTGSDGTWARTTDANETGEISAGLIVMVTEGSTYADTQWKLTTDDPITVGTTALTFVLNAVSVVGGSTTQIQYNDGGVLAGTANLTWASSELYVDGTANVTGNVTANSFIGDGSQLTGIASEKVILAIGDSWIATSEWTAAAERAFQRTVVNQAVGGRTSTDVLANLATDVAAAGGYESISLVVLGVGGNDKLAANSATISAANSTLYANLGNILAEITGNSVPVIMSPAPFVDGDDLEAGLPPDDVQFIDTGLYYDDPEYANIALGYPGVSVATNAMSYLIDNPDKFLIAGGFHPNDTTGVETYVNIIASAAQGLTEYSLNAAIGQTLDLLIFNSGIELGRTTSVNTPYIDFHTSGNANVDYDSRIVASGGDAVNNGTGNLTIYAGVANIVGNVDANNITLVNDISANVFLGSVANVALVLTDVANVVNDVNVGGNTQTTGNITGGNINTAGQVVATGNITGGNLITLGTLSTTSLTASGNITGGNIATAGQLKTTGTFLIGTQQFYAQGSDGFSVNENFNAGNANVTAYHYTSGSGRNAIVFDTAVTGQFTTGFGTTGSAASNKFVLFAEYGNTVWEWRKNVGISAPNLNGGNLLANISANGDFWTAGTITGTGNVTGGNLSVSTGTVTLGSIVNANADGVGNIGASGGSFNTVFAKATSAQYADVAEFYRADADYPIGTVLEFGGNQEVTAAASNHTTAIAGTVSESPAVIMNSGLDHEHRTAVALLGRVPCRVVGSIQKGDRLAASHLPGVATALDPGHYQPGCIIGKALENYDSDQEGIIEIVVGRL